MYFLRFTFNPNNDLKRNFSCNVNKWFSTKDEAQKYAVKIRSSLEPKQDPVTKKWCATPENGLSGKAFWDRNTFNKAKNFINPFVSGSDNYLAIFDANDYDLEYGPDGEDIFRNGKFIKFIDSATEWDDISGLFKNELTEATTEFVKKIIDPALMTLDEYKNYINKDHKHHPSSAYNMSLKDINRIYNDHTVYNELHHREKIAGEYFEFRIQKEKLQYCKSDLNGNYLRDKNNNLIYLTDEEIKTLGKNPYRYNVGAFDKNNVMIGYTADEWGTMLLVVAKEYRGLGFGPKLLKIAYELEPTKPSGGMTSAGSYAVSRMHSDLVRNYLESGMYSYLVRKGVISKEKVKNIINSIKNYKRKEKSSIDINLSDSSDYMIMKNYSSYIIYNKKILNYINDERLSYFKNKAILGMIYTLESTDGKIERIKIFGGNNDKIKKILLHLALSDTKKHRSKLAIEPDDLQYLPKNTEISVLNKIAGYDSHLVTYTGKILDTSILTKYEEAWRKQFDRYDEFKSDIIAEAEQKFKLY